MLPHLKLYSYIIDVSFPASTGQMQQRKTCDTLQLNRTMGIFKTYPPKRFDMEEEVIVSVTNATYNTFTRVYELDTNYKSYISLKFKDADDIFDFFVGAWYLQAKSRGIIRTQFYANRHYFTPAAVKSSKKLAIALVGFGIDCESLRQLGLLTDMNKCGHTYCSIVSECHEQMFLSICRIKETDN